MKNTLILGFLATALAAPAWALSTDNEQPIEVHADQFNGDEVKQTAVYTGNVIVDRGSIHLTGARLELAITPKGYRRATITGSPSRFKQQRDPKTPGIDEWVHARADRIVYDEETDKIILSGKAQLSRTENGTQKDMTSGERIIYDMRNARSEVNSGEGKRVTTIIAPRTKTNEAAPRQGASLSSSTKIAPKESKE